MIRHFVELYRIAIEHRYYANNQGRDVVLSPTPATLRLMQQYDLQWGKRGDQFVMLFARESGLRPKITTIEPNQALCFFLYSHDPNFMNFTDISFFHPKQQILYFDNTKTSGSSSIAQLDIVSNQDLLPVYGSRFEVKLSSGDIVALLDARQQIIAQAGQGDPKDLPWRVEENAPSTQVDLRSFSPGKYGLQTASGHIDWFYCAEPERQLHHYGIVVIYLDEASIQGANSTESKASVDPFKIVFEARSTLWRYYVINRSELAFDQLQVTNVGKEAFEVAEPRALRSGTQKAIPVFSKTPLKLQERQQLKPKLSLIQQKNNNEFTTSPTQFDLPTPDVQSITPEQPVDEPNAEQVIYSDMYI